MFRPIGRTTIGAIRTSPVPEAWWAQGTGKYQGWSGTFTDSVFVAFGAPTSGVGEIVYCDQVMFSFSGECRQSSGS
ncbi:MAG TPA: hypothetical protein VJ743_16915 [Albitalea sp.]|nr:hypothetical protein [Albitalea sp.]